MCRTPRSKGTPAIVWEKILEGTRDLSGTWLVRLALISIGVLGLTALLWRQGAALLIPLGMFAAVALPFSAFLSGHPFRIRYEIPIVVASALSIGLATGLLRKAAPIAALASSWSWSAATPTLSTRTRRWCAKRSSIARTGSAGRP